MTTSLERILVPTDFSDHAQHALLYAASLGERFGATLHLVHAVTLEAVGDEDPLAQFPDVDAHLEKADAAARTRLDVGVDHGGLASATVVRKVLQSVNPHEGIVRYAEEQAVDLIVIALKGKSPLSYMVMGSVTEKVIQFAPCPVLVVERGDRDFVDPDTAAVQLSKVVVGDNLSDNAAAALAFAVDKLAPYAPEIHLVHALEGGVPEATLDTGVSYSFEVGDNAQQRLEKVLRGRAAAVVPEDWTVECHFVRGKPHNVVTEAAAKLQADLLVVGREARRTLSERVAGGTSERMVRHAPCPTLIA